MKTCQVDHTLPTFPTKVKNYYIFCEDSSTGLGTVDGFSDYELHTGRDGQENVKVFTLDAICPEPDQSD